MESLPNLPLPSAKKKTKYDYSSFTDLINAKEEAIYNNDSSTLYFESVNIIKDNIDLFMLVVNSKCYSTFIAKDYECLKYIEEHLIDYSKINLQLLDDLNLKDRSYIDIDCFEKAKISIPFNYFMWNVNFKDIAIPNCCFNKNTLHAFRPWGFETISKDFLKRVKELVNKLNTYLVNKTDEEKIVLVSNYLQNIVQFVNENNISEASDGVYVTDSKYIVVDRETHSPMAVLDKHYGVCEGIAAATTLLLNNPTFNVDARYVYGDFHAWNAVKVKNNYYYVDNTWAITRNKDRYYEALKAKSFSSDYLLFGKDKANCIGHHNALVYEPEISEEDYPQNILEETKLVLSKNISFDNYEKPTFSSKIQR